MRRGIFYTLQKFAILWFLFFGCAGLNRAAVFGTFEKVAGCGSCTPSGTYPAFDTWVFKVRSSFSGDAMSLDFKAPAGGFFNDVPGTSFRDVASNPVQANVEIPETFIVVPTGASPLYATLVDTANELQSDYTTSGGLTLVHFGNTYVPVAFFSVPAGVQLGPANFISGVLAAPGDPIENIKYEVVPEPQSLNLIGILACCVCSLRRGTWKCFAS